MQIWWSLVGNKWWFLFLDQGLVGLVSQLLLMVGVVSGSVSLVLPESACILSIQIFVGLKYHGPNIRGCQFQEKKRRIFLISHIYTNKDIPKCNQISLFWNNIM